MWFKWLLVGMFALNAMAQIAKDDNTPAERVLGTLIEIALILGTLRYWGS